MGFINQLITGGHHPVWNRINVIFQDHRSFEKREMNAASEALRNQELPQKTKFKYPQQETQTCIDPRQQSWLAFLGRWRLGEWFASKTHLKTILDSPVHGGSGTTSQVNLSMDGIGKPFWSFLWEKTWEDHFSPAPSKSESRRQFLSPKNS